ncbi:unnamed protein product [Prunus armeniaca]|uniref:Uncharacterized protein n=1 Tax=Prunus armeniaca TaxID=36596 RepID=A0A6J5WV69_PRUAR|nr:unnamed protein product [Prunus armeniaca]
MQLDHNDDTWGGFPMGLDSFILVDEEMHRMVVRHQLQANNVRSQYQLNIEAHSYDQLLQDAAIIVVDIWPPPGIDLPYVPKPQGLELPHVPDPEDEAYLELLDFDALSTESIASATSMVIIEPQIQNLIQLSST